MNHVTFISREQAQRLVPPAGAVIISVHDKSEAPAQLQNGWAGRLTLEFHDTDGRSLGLTAFSAAMAAQVWQFVDSHLEAPELFVHCQMGVSRSAAIAMAIALPLAVPCYCNDRAVTPSSHPWLNKQVYFEVLTHSGAQKY